MAPKIETTGDRICRFSVIVALLLATAAFATAVRNHSIAAANIAAAREIKMFQGVGKTSFVALQKQLLSNPLEPNLLYGLIAHRVDARKAAELSGAERLALESLGWQSTIVQAALLQDAIAREDEAAALVRIDGLLRRSKSTEQLIDLLVQIEQTGNDAREKLIFMLSNKPRWRRDFLLAPSGMTGDRALRARFATLQLMFDNQLAPTPEEVAPIINLFLSRGDTFRAELLWRNLRKIGRSTSVPYDPNFARMAANSVNRQYPPIAYEWQIGEGQGFSVQASAVSNGDTVLRLRWDGRGAPVFLRQKLITAKGWLFVIVKGPFLERADIQHLNFVYYCEGFRPIFYDRPIQGAYREFIFTGDEAVGCDNPELLLIGNSENGVKSLEIELSSILIKRNISDAFGK